MYYYGLKAKILHFIFFIAHYVLKILHLNSRFFYKKALKYSLKYNDTKTERIGYMFDPQRFTSIYRRADMYPTKRIKFENMYVSAPNKIEVYLKTRYGDYMKLPPEDKRHTHLPESLIFDKKEKK